MWKRRELSNLLSHLLYCRDLGGECDRRWQKRQAEVTRYLKRRLRYQAQFFLHQICLLEFLNSIQDGEAPDGEDSLVDSVFVMYDARLLTTGIQCRNYCEHVPWSKLDDQMYWLSEYHAAKRTEYIPIDVLLIFGGDGRP